MKATQKSVKASALKSVKLTTVDRINKFREEFPNKEDFLKSDKFITFTTGTYLNSLEKEYIDMIIDMVYSGKTHNEICKSVQNSVNQKLNDAFDGVSKETQPKTSTEPEAIFMASQGKVVEIEPVSVVIGETEDPKPELTGDEVEAELKNAVNAVYKKLADEINKKVYEIFQEVKERKDLSKPMTVDDLNALLDKLESGYFSLKGNSDELVKDCASCDDSKSESESNPTVNQDIEVNESADTNQDDSKKNSEMDIIADIIKSSDGSESSKTNVSDSPKANTDNGSNNNGSSVFGTLFSMAENGKSNFENIMDSLIHPKLKTEKSDTVNHSETYLENLKILRAIARYVIGKCFELSIDDVPKATAEWIATVEINNSDINYDATLIDKTSSDRIHTIVISMTKWIMDNEADVKYFLDYDREQLAKNK